MSRDSPISRWIQHTCLTNTHSSLITQTLILKHSYFLDYTALHSWFNSKRSNSMANGLELYFSVKPPLWTYNIPWGSLWRKFCLHSFTMCVTCGKERPSQKWTMCFISLPDLLCQSIGGNKCPLRTRLGPGPHFSMPSYQADSWLVLISQLYRQR